MTKPDVTGHDGELGTAATRLRDLATRTATTLFRHEVEWTDLTVSDTAAQAKARPMVWSQYAAAMSPTVGAAVADWLGCLAMLDPSERGGDACGWCGVDHALTIARALNGRPDPAAVSSVV